MHPTIAERLASITLGEPQIHQNLTIIPLVDGDHDAVHYLTLGEALDAQLFTVTEVSDQGSVPHLKVVNQAETMVLLLDGEKLAGAKQNRVLNASVLVGALQSLVIPVSCTEAGRWRYRTNAAFESRHHMERNMRARKTAAVSESLAAREGFQSDQREIWRDIDELSRRTEVRSHTSAMSDVYRSHEGSLDEVLQAFPTVPDQVGFLAVIDGDVVGLDLVSRPEAYGRLHGKLVRSYAIAGLAGEKAESRPPAAEVARSFLAQVMQSEVEPYESVGCGEDFRVRGPRITGSALVLNETVVHAAIFRLDEER